ncbi:MULTISPECIES: hypothetical protein [Pseudomonadota]|uniref:hypothetical protein n=1 Tax=Pseudomonadota TaxID=1224 RepID=UPI00260BFB38|nr:MULTISPECIES: hypothetical protein [Pseudomonadota]
MADPAVKDPEDEVVTDPAGETPPAETPPAGEAGKEGGDGGEQEVQPTEDNQAPAPEDLLSMSDEDFEKMEQPPTPSETPEGTEPPEGREKGAAPVEDPKKEVTQPSETPGDEPKPEAKAEGGEPDKDKDKAPAPAGSDEPITADKKAEIYDAVFSGFKANGKDIQVETPEEAVRLMQMGAGFVKYQQKVRPALAIQQTLDHNKIDNNQLNFLIDCANGKVDAIKKLVRDAKLEPYDIENTDAARSADKEYRPTNHLVSDKDVALTENIGTVQGTPNGDAILRTIQKDWDDDSRNRLVEDPEILPILVRQKDSGVYDQITSEVNRRQTLGTLANNVSWLDAYYQVGSDLEKSGAFSTGSESTSSPSTETATTPAESKVIETAAAKKKAAAGGDPSGVAPVKQAPAVQPKVDASVMDMSDEDFAKLEEKLLG